MNKSSILTAAALLSLAPCASAALIAAWTQDESSGNIIDQLGGPQGVPTGTPLYGQAGVPNGTYGAITVTNAAGSSIGYGPSASDVYFTVGTDNNNAVMNIPRTGTMTVMGWVNPNSATISATYRFLSTGTDLGADRGWGIGLRFGTAGSSTANIRFTNYGVADTDSSAFTAAAGTWVHLAVTYNNGAIAYYVNGVAAGTNTSLFGDEGTNARLVIGGRFGGNDVDQMNGLVDGIRVYDTVLTSSAIISAAVSSVSVPEPTMAAFSLLAGGLFIRRRRS